MTDPKVLKATLGLYNIMAGLGWCIVTVGAAQVAGFGGFCLAFGAFVVLLAAKLRKVAIDEMAAAQAMGFVDSIRSKART